MAAKAPSSAAVARPTERAVQTGFYGAGSPAFFKLLSDWRAAGDLAGLELS